MVHNLFDQPENQPNLDIQEKKPQIIEPHSIIELLKTFLLNGDIISRTLTLEGVCRLVYNKKLGNNSDDMAHDLVVLLLLIWNDSLILK